METQRSKRVASGAVLAPVLLALLIAFGGLSNFSLAAPYVSKGATFNTAVSGDGKIFSADLTPRASQVAVTYRLTIGLESTDSVVNATITVDGTTKKLDLNSGTALTAGVLYGFEFDVPQSVGGDAVTVNAEVETGTTVAYATLVEQVRR